jgi:hypothetical protein
MLIPANRHLAAEFLGDLLIALILGTGLMCRYQYRRNEGIYVNGTDLKFAKGAANGEPAAQLGKSSAREMADGAIIVGSGSKLYRLTSQ